MLTEKKKGKGGREKNTTKPGVTRRTMSGKQLNKTTQPTREVKTEQCSGIFERRETKWRQTTSPENAGKSERAQGMNLGKGN